MSILLKTGCYLSLLLLIGLALHVPTAFASTIFQDNFQDVNGTTLSAHNAHWSSIDFEPGSGRWGEYVIQNNQAGDGSGLVFNADSLDFKLSSHFLVSENYTYSNTVSDDTYHSFMEMRIETLLGGEYIFRFDVNQPHTGYTVEVFGLYPTFTSLGTYVYDVNDLSLRNTISVEYNSGLFAASINGVPAISFTDHSQIPDHIVITQTRFVPTAVINSFTLEDLATPSATPVPSLLPTPVPTPVPTATPLPTVSPTPIPTPVPTPKAFPITAYSQRDPIWKNQVYDTAETWAPGKTAIERWGCAVTSASTILDYYGIHKLPNGQSNNPGTLNAWLKTQPDGYLGEGAINWNAVSRASKLASTASPQLPSLEYKRISNTFPDLITRLNNQQPVILEEPGHFVTAYRYDLGSKTTQIIDPYWGTIRPTLSSYSNSFISARTFTPSHTNLGYIMIVSDQDISSSIKNTNSFTEQPIIDQSTPSIHSNSQPIQVLEFPQPATDSYQAVLHRSSSGAGNFKIYTYDANGDPTITSYRAIFGSKDLTLAINYRVNGKSTVQKHVNFQTLRDDLKEKHRFFFDRDDDEFLKLIDRADAYYSKNRQLAKETLRIFEIARRLKNNRLFQDLDDVLNADLNLLQSQIF